MVTVIAKLPVSFPVVGWPSAKTNDDPSGRPPAVVGSVDGSAKGETDGDALGSPPGAGEPGRRL